MKPVIIIAIAFVLLFMPLTSFAEPIREPESKICTTQYDPVCGISGKTYSNLCMLQSSDDVLNYEGQCVGTESELKRKTLCTDGTVVVDGECQIESIEEISIKEELINVEESPEETKKESTGWFDWFWDLFR